MSNNVKRGSYVKESIVPTGINRERVKVLRLGKSWTQQRLADKAGISLRSIQRIESDGSASLQSREAIAEAFGIEAKDLEQEASQPTSNLVVMIVVAVFSYLSFFAGLEIFNVRLAELEYWAVPLIPSITMLIFGMIMISSASQTRKRLLTITACIVVALLMSPPRASLLQILFAIGLYIGFEIIAAAVTLLARQLPYSKAQA